MSIGIVLRFNKKLTRYAGLRAQVVAPESKIPVWYDGGVFMEKVFIFSQHDDL